MRHYHCVSGEDASDELQQLWNAFRMPVVDYLLATDPEIDVTNDSPPFWALQPALDEVDGMPGVSREALRKVALAMLDRFDCDWTMASLGDRFREANRDLNAGLPDEALDAIANATAQRVV
jgi:hypothetical protein